LNLPSAVFSSGSHASRFGPSAAKFASQSAQILDQPHLHFLAFPPFSSFSPLYTTGDRIPTTHPTIQQMYIERNNTNILSFYVENQMRTEINLQKLFRNYRSQIRVDAERRRGAP